MLGCVCAVVKTAWQRLGRRRGAPRHNGGLVAFVAGQRLCGEEEVGSCTSRLCGVSLDEIHDSNSSGVQCHRESCVDQEPFY